MDRDKVPSGIELPVRNFKILAIRTGRLSILEKIWYIILTCSSLAHVILTTSQFFGTQININDLTKNLESLSSCLQIFVIIMTTMYYKEEIFELINLSKQFLYVDNYAPTDKRIGLKSFIHMVKQFQWVFLISALSFIVLSEFGVLLGKLPLITGTWVWQDCRFLYYLEATIQVTMLPVYSLLVTGVDTLFIGLNSELGVQFRLLKYYLEDLFNSHTNSETFNSKIKFFVDHHNFLLGFLKRFQRVFSIVLLIEYVLSALLMCAELYFVAEKSEGAGLGFFVRTFTLYIMQLIQLAAYLLPAEYCISETEILSYAVYNSKWHEMKQFSTLRTFVVMVAQKSQIREEFTMGYLANANAMAMLKAMKLSFSSFMLLRSLKKQ